MRSTTPGMPPYASYVGALDPVEHLRLQRRPPGRDRRGAALRDPRARPGRGLRERRAQALRRGLGLPRRPRRRPAALPRRSEPEPDDPPAGDAGGPRRRARPAPGSHPVDLQRGDVRAGARSPSDAADVPDDAGNGRPYLVLLASRRRGRASRAASKCLHSSIASSEPRAARATSASTRTTWSSCWPTMRSATR